MTGAEPAVPIDAALVRRLIASQFPHWAELAVEPVALSGWDNRTFRLGERMAARLPSAGQYAAQVAKEQRWLPWLAPRLPLPIPAPVAKGAPGAGYPWSWSIYRWLAGENASTEAIADFDQFALALAAFLTALWRVDTTAGPPPGPHNFFRGGPLATYDDGTRAAIAALASTGGGMDAEPATAVWEAALASHWRGPPVWLHGDIAAGNLLIDAGRLCAVIDFGCCGVGDPACDLTIAWTLLPAPSRALFRAHLNVDAETWARARGWALWKALITMTAMTAQTATSETVAVARRVVEMVGAEHETVARAS